jgi:hypothetical protein
MHPTEVLFPPGSPAAFPSPRFKASGFASHPFRWFALTSIFIHRLRRLTQIIYFKNVCARLCGSVAKRELYRAKQMPILIAKVEMSSGWSKDDFGRIKMLLNFRGLGRNYFFKKFWKNFQWFLGSKFFTIYIDQNYNFV